VKRGGGGYLCYDCLKKAKVQPLPGALDHRTFERTKVELGRCDVSGRCNTRVVREWTGREGMR